MGRPYVTVKKEFGEWSVRINGHFIDSFWREGRARRVAMAIAEALTDANRQSSEDGG